MPIRTDSVIGTCPTCGSKHIRRKTIDLKMSVNGRTRVIPQIELEICPDCGEKLFDKVAMDQVEKVFPPRRRVKAKKA